MRRLRRARLRHTQEVAKRRKKLNQKALAAGTAAAIALGAGVGMSKAVAYTPEPHRLPVSPDADKDLLADGEETTLGYLVFDPDQNHNQIRDGAELAGLCWGAINALPWQNEAGPGETYKWWAPQFGVENCAICGEAIVMGPGGVVNPQLAISVEFPFQMSLHYMMHGSFSYAISDAEAPVEGRVDVPALLTALRLRLPCEPNDHQLPVEKDTDDDLLANREEFAIGYRPFRSDQNRNRILDGVELAKRCAAVVHELPMYFLWDPPPGVDEPYRICHEVDGVEQCDVCGEWIHMGGCTIVNPRIGLRYPDPNDPVDGLFLPDLALHYMEHGSFDCLGSIHRGRVDLQRLTRVLELRFPCEPNDHQLPLDYPDPCEPGKTLAPDTNDLDGDFMADSEELAARFNLYDPDQNHSLTPDGIELARQCAAVIDSLPEEGVDPIPEGRVYKQCWFQRGLELCDICGQSVNMGFWRIINPKLGLSVDVYDITCHYMSHGSFSYFGRWTDSPYEPFHYGRIDIGLLTKVLGVPRTCSHLGAIRLPADLDEDGMVNFKDIAELADKWLKCTDPTDPGCDQL
ncbi:MAG: hypothetical protein ACYS76_01860 [Planctomycetota bacterium]|jgi:hypothetical protein